MVGERVEARFHDHAAERDAGCAARWDERCCEQLRLHVFIQPCKPNPPFSSRAETHKPDQLDYTCGIIPVTHVDKALDQLPATFRFQDLNGVAKGAYKHYNANDMHGLPVAVQVVGQRLQEEKVLAFMTRVEDALDKHGGRYELLAIE